MTQITIDKVLFVQDDGDISVGQPLVEGATVEATVLQHLRDRKIIVYKMRPKKKTRKKQGHRQELTRLMINTISMGGSALKGATQASDSKAISSELETTTATLEADDA